MPSTKSKVFDYRALRLMMGIIALALPIIVSLRASTPLSSISVSYYTEARDFFVGLLFFVAAFLFAYHGNSPTEALVSNVACVAAIMVAIFPTYPDGGSANVVSYIHYFSAAVLFGVLAYFCLGPFRRNTKGQTGKKGRRDLIYVTCGWTIIVCMLGMFLTKLLIPEDVSTRFAITYWAELGALWAFGIAWLVAGKTIGLFVDEKDKYKPFENWNKSR